MMATITRILILLLCAFAITSCGLATSDKERLARADEHMASGAYRSAMIELKNVLVGNPDNFSARLLLAEVSLGLADVATAEKELARASDAGAPESGVRPLHLRILSAQNQYTEMLASLGMETGGLSSSQILDFRGQALLGLGNVEAARENYQEWLALEPGSIDAMLGIAKSEAADGKLGDAMNGLEDIVANSPEHVDALFALGGVQFLDSRYDESEKSLEKAMQHSKPEKDLRRYTRILASLTDVRLILGKMDDARFSLGRLASIVPQSPVTLFLSARLARMEEDYALAARHLQALLNVNPENARARMFLANVQMMQGNYAQAESLLGRVVATSPGNLQARKWLAQVQLKQSQPAGAIEALSPLLEKATGDQGIYELLAQANLQQGDAQSAIENFRAAAKQAPDDVEAKLNLAAAYLNAGESKLALEVLEIIPEGQGAGFRRERLMMTALFEQENHDAADTIARNLVRENADDSGVMTIVAGHYLRSGNKKAAREILDNHVTSSEASADAILALAWIELDDGDLEQAQTRFSQLHESDPESLGAALGHARISALRGDAQNAIDILRAAARQHTNSLVPRVWLAIRYIETTQTKLAEEMADELMAIGFRNARVSQIVGTAYLDSGRTEEALSQFSLAQRLDPGSATAQFNLARAYLVLGRNVEAQAALTNALTISPNWLLAKVNLALVELSQGNLAEAMRHTSELTAIHADNAAVMLLEGEVFVYEKDFAKAAEAFHRAVQAGAGRNAMLKEFQSLAIGRLDEPESPLVSWLTKNPDDIGVRMQLAQFFQQTNANGEAVLEYERILEADPDNATVLNNLAWQYQQQSELDRAHELASKAYELNPGSGAITDTLGWILRDLGQLDESLKIIREASRLSPDNGEIKYHYAVVLSESGDTERARQILETLKNDDAQFPSREQANNLLGEL